ncbi:MAG: hypothetical protein JW863_07315 [Chitinispirillaceae bacterium]|nr:hypothetical protein [Chitinispirillaceae bacterium]
MHRELELSFSPEEHERLPPLKGSTCGEKDLSREILRRDTDTLPHHFLVTILKKSIDARNKRKIRIHYKVLISNSPPITSSVAPAVIRRSRSTDVPVVTGSGPAGMFAALTLARNGVPPVIIERGRPVEQRVTDVRRHFNGGELLSFSNVQFGEGGAGTFSDGKLYSGVSDGRRALVLDTFVNFGAPPDIRYLAHPHIGTDRLRDTVINIRNEIISLGGRFLFERTVDDIVFEKGSLQGIRHSSSQHPDNREFLNTGNLILAIGHSARDTYVMLKRSGITLQAKPFAVGIRIEHLQESINRAQYGACFRHAALPPAEYRLVARTATGRSLFTFCMCPGGYVVAGASQPGQVVTNGMSNYRRDERNANSAILAGVDTGDFPGNDVLAGMEFQKKLEKAAFIAGGANGRAPCQRLGDFLTDTSSTSCGMVEPTYRPGVTYTNLRPLLPPVIAATIQEGIRSLDRKLHGFAHPDSILTGIETRSSAPVRILRGGDLCSPDVRGLYPCGEGAGYAGGIMSSAIDGIRCAEQLLEAL